MFKPSLKPIQTIEEIIAADASKQFRPAHYNVLPFDHPLNSLDVYFSTQAFPHAHRFSLDLLPEESQELFTGLQEKPGFVYSDFSTQEGLVPVKTELHRYRAIARAYYTKLIRDHLSKFADVVVTNFLYDSTFWLSDSSQDTPLYRVYKKYGIRVQFDHNTSEPELLVSYEGISRTCAASLSQLIEKEGFSIDFVSSIVFRKTCCLYKYSPEAARYHPEEVFPVLNRKLSSFSGIKMSNKPDKIKHKRYQDEVMSFIQSHLLDPSFQEVLPLKGTLKPVPPSNQLSIQRNSNQLLFGEGNLSKDPMNGLKRYGPARLPGFDKIQYFFIYNEHDRLTVEKAYNLIRKDCKIAGGLKEYITQPYEPNKSLSITFDPDKNPLDTILDRIRELDLEPETAYYAFFISPWTEWEPDKNKWIIHPRIKEALLRRGIMMQTIDAGKLIQNNSSLAYYMPNLAIAMTAKLGGIPWRLNSGVKDELIIGFGAFRSQKYNIRYVGASFCFSSDGTFRKFDCFRADELQSLAGSVEEAFYSYRDLHKDVKRIVIHFYKKLSRKELKPLEQMLKRLEIDIPVIVVSINKTFSNDRVVFVEEDEGGLPVAGSIFRYAAGQYLFYINDRLSYQQTKTRNMPMPLKISLSANKKEVLEDQGLIIELMQQTYDFCFMYWRSMLRSNLPVTVAYPEMIARIFPWFSDEALNDEGMKTMWFL